MGLLQTQKEIATKTGYPLYCCQELPQKTLFKKANVEGKANVIPVYIDIKPQQGALHIRDNRIVNFMLAEGFYFIDNTIASTYNKGQCGFQLSPDQLVLNNFPLIGEHVYFVNLQPIKDVVVEFDEPIKYRDANGEYLVNCKLTFDVEVVNPIILFKNVVKNSDTEHYLTDALFNNISTILKKHVQQQFQILSNQSVSRNFIKQNKMVLLQNFEAKTSALSSVGLAITNVDVDECAFILPQNEMFNTPNDNAYTPVPSQSFYEQPYTSQQQFTQSSQLHEFNISEIGTTEEPQQQKEPVEIEGLNLSFVADETPNYGFQPQQQVPQQGAGYSLYNDEWLCPMCKNEAFGNVCGFCGYKRDTNSQTYIPAPTTQTQWQCPTCGMSNTLKFCSNCGAKKPLQGKIACSNCGYRIENPNNPPKFCPECGSKF